MVHINTFIRITCFEKRPLVFLRLIALIMVQLDLPLGFIFDHIGGPHTPPPIGVHI